MAPIRAVYGGLWCFFVWLPGVSFVKPGLIRRDAQEFEQFLSGMLRWDVTAGNEECVSSLATRVSCTQPPPHQQCVAAPHSPFGCQVIIKVTGADLKIFQVTDGSRDAFGCLTSTQRTLRRSILLKLCWTGHRQTYPLLPLFSLWGRRDRPMLSVFSHPSDFYFWIHLTWLVLTEPRATRGCVLFDYVSIY